MKYFKCENDVYAFELDGSQDHLISDQHIPMSADEIDRHINPENYLSEEEKEQLRLIQFKPLTRRQFKLALLENGLLETVEQMISGIEDPSIKARIQIEYSESERFERGNEAVQFMLGILNIPSSKVDEMWSSATKF